MIFKWWKTNRRDLPWRQTRDPYSIAVSEIMLQQTQVSRVLPKYLEFMNIFPTVKELAQSSPGTVLRIWKGMGYNRRALYLHNMAKEIVDVHNGMFPNDDKSLIKLPGLGKYTARAILVFAFGENISCVDTNIRQIITHFFFSDKEQSEKIIQYVADQLVPKGKSWEWHQSLMDFGAMNASEWRHPKYRRRAKKKTIPFKETDRFIRGKIIDCLRVRQYTNSELVKIITALCEKPVEKIQNILERLKKEDLIEEHNKMISLPK